MNVMKKKRISIFIFNTKHIISSYIHYKCNEYCKRISKGQSKCFFIKTLTIIRACISNTT